MACFLQSRFRTVKIILCLTHTILSTQNCAQVLARRSSQSHAAAPASERRSTTEVGENSTADESTESETTRSCFLGRIGKLVCTKTAREVSNLARADSTDNDSESDVSKNNISRRFRSSMTSVRSFRNAVSPEDKVTENSNSGTKTAVNNDQTTIKVWVLFLGGQKLEFNFEKGDDSKNLNSKKVVAKEPTILDLRCKLHAAHYETDEDDFHLMVDEELKLRTKIVSHSQIQLFAQPKGNGSEKGDNERDNDSIGNIVDCEAEVGFDPSEAITDDSLKLEQFKRCGSTNIKNSDSTNDLHGKIIEVNFFALLKPSPLRTVCQANRCQE